METIPNTSTPPNNGKTVAIVSYITLIGWIVALIIHSDKKTSLGAYHLRQSLGLMILGLAVGILRFILSMLPFGGVIAMALAFGMLALWLFGIINAANGEEKPMPVVGGMFQKWFAGLGV